MERCLLQTATNSIRHCVATACINNLDFGVSTKRLSQRLVREWERRNSQRFGPSQGPDELVDLSRLVQIRLAVVLYELHLRLTVYQYFGKSSQAESLVDASACSVEVGQRE